MGRRAWLSMAVSIFAAAAQAGDDGSYFRQHVAPILERHCVECHGGLHPKGDLDLSTAAGVTHGGESGPVIESSKPDESLLLANVTGEKPAMPKGARPLAADEVEVLRQWIADGARWPAGLVLGDPKARQDSWWSLVPLAKVSPPPAQSWARTPVDAFILATLDNQHLAPSPAADRRTLIRRLTYDLHGLPPSPEEIRAFVDDDGSEAYERLVDRLLASPRYGERWGRHWLDVVHYGESHGYDKDKPRPNAWPYRDYVITSLNDDKPYDRFVAEQVAGDVLFPGDPAATVGTGFIAAGPWDFVGHVELREGTADKEIARSNDRDDMVANTMSTFLSLTAHCARCHDHKFDPIAQRDYYALQAVFAGIDRADRPYDRDPDVARRRAEWTAAKIALELQLAAIRGRMATIASPKLATLDAQLARLKSQLAEAPDAAASTTLGYHSQIMPTAMATKWVQVDLGQQQPIERIVLVPAHVVHGGHAGPGFGFPPRFKVEVSDSADFAEAHLVADHTAADFAAPAGQSVLLPATGVVGRYARVTATKLWRRTDDWIFALAELQVISGSDNVALGKKVASQDSIEAPPGWAMKNLVDGRDSRQQIGADGHAVPDRRVQLDHEIAVTSAARKSTLREQLDIGTRQGLETVERQLSEIAERLAALPEPQKVFAALAQSTARPIHLLVRGDVRQPGPLIPPAGVPAVCGLEAGFGLDAAAPEASRRAALARWLVDGRNALLRRSIVNRIWQYHFGQGIVDTANDFGRMGSLPTHPDLLEWLAGWFADQGHSLKKLHRLLVTSAVYRQSSQNVASHAQIDAGNRFLWRMHRARLDAECVRDAMLAVTGMLDPAMGGPSVRQFYFKDDHSPVYDYTRFDVDDPSSLRRSIYRFLVRSVPDPFMECLDCADPSLMTPKRNTTITSLQSLALLNNPFTTRQAEHFAARLRTIAADTDGQIVAGYLLALGRAPRDQERAALVAYAEHFGLANACRVIFNSNEFIFLD